MPFIEHYFVLDWALLSELETEALVIPSATIKCFIALGERPRVDIAGPARTHHRSRFSGAGRMMGISFLPGGFARFSAVPVGALWQSGPVHASDVLGAGVAELRDRLAEATSDDAAFSLLDAHFLERLSTTTSSGTEACVRAFLAELSTSPRPPRIGAIRNAIGVGERRLQRAFETSVGVAPSFAVRLERLHRGLRGLARGGASLARVALESGYFDQAHFTNEVKTLTGHTPAELSGRLRSVGSVQEARPSAR